MVNQSYESQVNTEGWNPKGLVVVCPDYSRQRGAERIAISPMRMPTKAECTLARLTQQILHGDETAASVFQELAIETFGHLD